MLKVPGISPLFLFMAMAAIYYSERTDGFDAKAKLISHEKAPKMASNPVTYFEIPVNDLDRAVEFYQNVFGYAFERQTIDGNEMALFPILDNATGIAGALAKGEAYVPSQTGSVLYFNTDDIDAILKKVATNGGRTLYQKTSIGELGYVAEFEDIEGNRIALHSPARH